MTTITKDQAQMLANLACAARPVGARQWKPDEVMAELAKLTDRNLGAVICAVTRCAMDRGAQRPSCISGPGSHWGDTMVSQPAPPFVDSGSRCSVCGMSEPACRVRHSVDDHEFLSAAETARRSAGVDEERTAAIRATLEPTSGPTPRRTPEDFAEAKPELHERIEALRTNNPGLAGLGLREPEPVTEQDETNQDEREAAAK